MSVPMFMCVGPALGMKWRVAQLGLAAEPLEHLQDYVIETNTDRIAQNLYG